MGAGFRWKRPAVNETKILLRLLFDQAQNEPGERRNDADDESEKGRMKRLLIAFYDHFRTDILGDDNGIQGILDSQDLGEHAEDQTQHSQE